MIIERSVLRDQFLTNKGYKVEQLCFLASDMSPRQYYRLQDTNLLLMDAPSLINIQQYINVALYLKEKGLRSPNIQSFDLENGFILLEDFGDITFTKALQYNPLNEKILYHKALKVLQHLQKHSKNKPDFIPLYTTELLLKEVEVFIDWYWLASKGDAPTQNIKQDYLKRWKYSLIT